MRKPLRAPAKAPRKVRAVRTTRTLTLKRAVARETISDDARHLEAISRRYEESELAWLRMTAPPEGDETWNKVEEHLLTQRTDDKDRRWKFFAK
jgi:hypothetical protein